MSEDLDALVAEAAEAVQAVREADAVVAAARRVRDTAAKREHAASKALFSEIDRRVQGDA